MSQGRDAQLLGSLVAAALRRRIGMARAITTKQCAYDLQVAETTLWNWMNGNGAPAGQHIVGMLNYFDSAFAWEIGVTSGEFVKLSDARLAAARKLNEALRELTEGKAA